MLHCDHKEDKLFTPVPVWRHWGVQIIERNNLHQIIPINSWIISTYRKSIHDYNRHCRMSFLSPCLFLDWEKKIWKCLRFQTFYMFKHIYKLSKRLIDLSTENLLMLFLNMRSGPSYRDSPILMSIWPEHDWDLCYHLLTKCDKQTHFKWCFQLSAYEAEFSFKSDTEYIFWRLSAIANL